MTYEILDHTADAKFRAVGDTLEKAFSEAVKAFGEIVGSDPEAGDTRHSIEIESENRESLLFDFLDELVLLQDTEGVAVCHAEELEIRETENGYSLNATVWTDNITAGMNLLDIKAPTYNEMEATYYEGEGWVVQAVLDI